MLLLKSLICLKGHDNGLRFLVISAISYLLLLLLLPVLPKAVILVALVVLVITPVLLASGMRRVHDAHFATAIAVIPVVIYWLNLFGLTYLEHGAKWVLLVIGILSSLAFSVLNNVRIRKNQNYVLGYNGPANIDPTVNEVTTADRIEPTLAGQAPLQYELDDSPSIQHADDLTQSYTESARAANSQVISAQQQHSSSAKAPFGTQFTEIQTQLNQWFQSNRNISYALLALIVISILLVFTIPSLESDEESVEKKVEDKSAAFVKQRLNKIEMPDQFFIMLDQNDALTIGWEGDLQEDSGSPEGIQYWSAATGQGDKDCINLAFTLGKKFKSLKVSVKRGGEYYADFSPVDTRLIINAIANKDRFKLCGYEFTLKGTRSLLTKNSKYRSYLK